MSSSSAYGRGSVVGLAGEGEERLLQVAVFGGQPEHRYVLRVGESADLLGVGADDA
jgi:hypothetical protein